MHGALTLALNICLTLVVCALIGLALRAIIKQRASKKPLGCLGCPYSDTCKQSVDSCERHTAKRAKEIDDGS